MTSAIGTAPDRSRSQTWLDSPVLWLGLAAFTLLASWIGVATRLFNHDVGWILHVAGLLLDGGRLYVDVYDVNPPLYAYLTVPIVWASRVTGLSGMLVYDLVMFAVAGASLALTARVLRRSTALAGTLERRALLLALVVAWLPLAGADFGQRDVIMAMMITPLLALAMRRHAREPVGWKLALAVGLWSGLGIALKPFFLLLVVVLELHLLLARKSPFWRRPETLTIAAMHLVYGAVVVLLVPQYLAMASLAGQTYGAYNATLGQMLATAVRERPVIVAALLGALLVRPARSLATARRVLLGSCLCFVAIYLIQAKGFPYHLYPARALATLLLTEVILSAAITLPGGRLARLRPALWPLALCALLAREAALSAWKMSRGYLGRPSNSYFKLVNTLRAVARDQPITVLSSSMYPAFPAVNYSGARWAGRWVTLWVLPGVYRQATAGADGTIYHARNEMTPLEGRLVDEVIQDMERFRPVVVIVDERVRKQAFGETRFDFLPYFRREPAFALLWNDYEFFDRIEDFALYRRRSTSP